MLRTRMLAAAAGLAAGWLCAPAEASLVGMTVYATANIFAAGRATASSGIPPSAYSFPAGPGKVLTFSSIHGWVQFRPNAPRTGPEGGPWS
ncbi:MAG: hypothetical protein FJW34_25045, partial [Acidobacteria bacterium]|nr:hypothetical protein [Acidobacteriota bacterium]